MRISDWSSDVGSSDLARRVTAVTMPTRYTSQLSLDGARAQAEQLGVDYHVIPIQATYQSFMEALTPAFAGKSADTTEENLQSRTRGVMLMALSNKHGRLLPATGNKSEMAVGSAPQIGRASCSASVCIYV